MEFAFEISLKIIILYNHILNTSNPSWPPFYFLHLISFLFFPLITPLHEITNQW
jgi:hypothetical protein